MQFLPIPLLLLTSMTCAQPISSMLGRVPNPYHIQVNDIDKPKEKIKTGADQTDQYLPYLKGKKVGMVINATSIIGKKSPVLGRKRSQLILIKQKNKLKYLM